MKTFPNKIKAVLLAAGMGTRLQPLTDILPKCLMPINGRPLLEYWLHNLTGAGVDDILINTHCHAEMVEQWFRESIFTKTAQTVWEEQLLGTGGTVLRNRDFIDSHPALIIHADNLCRIDLPAFIAAES